MIDNSTTTEFTDEELDDIVSRLNASESTTMERFGLRFVFGQEYDDDRSTIDRINDEDVYGKVGWPERDRCTGNETRPAGFTGAARKFSATPMHDTIWWEPYREGSKVYDDADEVGYMASLLDWGFIGCTLRVDQRESCGHWHEATSQSLWGIESPMVHGAGHLVSIYRDLIADALYEMRGDQ